MRAEGKRQGEAGMDPVPQGGQQIPEAWRGKRVAVMLPGRVVVGELVEVNDKGVIVDLTKPPQSGGGRGGFVYAGGEREENTTGQYFCPWGQVQFIHLRHEGREEGF
jgi:hypothetical protein